MGSKLENSNNGGLPIATDYIDTGYQIQFLWLSLLASAPHLILCLFPSSHFAQHVHLWVDLDWIRPAGHGGSM